MARPRYTAFQVRSILAGLHGTMDLRPGNAGSGSSAASALLASRPPVKTPAPGPKLPTATTVTGETAEITALRNKITQLTLQLSLARTKSSREAARQATSLASQISVLKKTLDASYTENMTVYKDAAGNTITKAEYERLMAAAQNAPAYAYQDANGNPITEAQYNQLVAEYEAEQKRLQAEADQVRTMTTKPVEPPKEPVVSTPMPKRDVQPPPAAFEPQVSTPLPKAPIPATPAVVQTVVKLNQTGVTPVVAPRLAVSTGVAKAPVVQAPEPIAVVLPAAGSTSATAQAAAPQVVYASPGAANDAYYPSAPTVSQAAASVPTGATAEEVQAATGQTSSGSKTALTLGVMAAVPLVMGFLGDK